MLEAKRARTHRSAPCILPVVVVSYHHTSRGELGSALLARLHPSNGILYVQFLRDTTASSILMHFFGQKAAA